jgi:hypothetical protein
MIHMPNRFGEGIAPPLPAVDRTRIFIARLMLKKPRVQFEFLPDGNIRFKLPLDDAAMSPADLANAKLLRTKWFANAVGEFLLRTNIEALDDYIQREDFPCLAEQNCHTNFGLWIRPHSLQFQFHCQLLNQIFNESLRWELRTA